MREIDLTREVIETFSKFERRLFRHNVGAAWQGKWERQPNGTVVIQHPRRIEFGLAPGGGDIIGLVSKEIHPEHVGERWAVFTSLEDKSGGARVREGQKNWHEMVKMMGGISGVYRTLDEAAALLGVKRK